MDLLIMSLAQAKHLKHIINVDVLWGHIATIVAFGILAIFIFYVLPYFLKKYNVKENTYDHVMPISITILSIMAIIGFFGSMPGAKVTHTDLSVADNIGCYYKMRQLDNQYRKISSKPKTVTFTPSHSLSKDTAQMKKIKHIHYLTNKQQKIMDAYKSYQHSYRNRDGNETGTGSARLTPKTIHWWAYI